MNKWTPVIAILAIVILEALALSRGVDGALLGIAIAAISGLGGYEVKALRENRRRNRK